jgi:hypothetical protein
MDTPVRDKDVHDLVWFLVEKVFKVFVEQPRHSHDVVVIVGDCLH